jgi:hypothetical protein
MATIRCDDFLNQVESWMEGDRRPDAEAHVRGCRACRSLVSDLETIQSTARSWEIAEPVEPPARVWASLRFRLEAEGLIHGSARDVQHVAEIPVIADQPKGSLEHRAGWLERILAGVPRPALAGAYLVALIAAGFALSGPGSQRGSGDHWAQVTQSATTPLRSELDTVEYTVSSLAASDPIVTASLHKNLAIVDNYIALCEKSVREEPGNEIARDYLYGAYQQKADLLAQMTENGDGR